MADPEKSFGSTNPREPRVPSAGHTSRARSNRTPAELSSINREGKMKSWLATFASLGVWRAWRCLRSRTTDHGNKHRGRAVFRRGVGELTNEVPAVSTAGTGHVLCASSIRRATDVHVLADLLGPRLRRVTQAHIHFGQHHTNGGISVWLCQSGHRSAPATVAAERADVPAGTTMPITATVTAADVIGPTGQGIAPWRVCGARCSGHARWRGLRERSLSVA